MQLCIVLLLVVWFEFEFVEFKFKSNLLNLFAKRKKKEKPFRPKPTVRPVFLFRAVRSATRLFSWHASQKSPLHPYINTRASLIPCAEHLQAAAGPSPLSFPSCMCVLPVRRCPSRPAPCAALPICSLPLLPAVHACSAPPACTSPVQPFPACAPLCCMLPALPLCCRREFYLFPSNWGSLLRAQDNAPKEFQADHRSAVPSGFDSHHHDSSLPWVSGKTVSPRSHRFRSVFIRSCCVSFV